MTRRVLLSALLRYSLSSKSRCTASLLLVAVVWLAAACVSTNLPPIGSSGSGAFAPETDERRLWSALEQAEGQVAPPKYLYVIGSRRSSALTLATSPRRRPPCARTPPR